MRESLGFAEMVLAVWRMLPMVLCSSAESLSAKRRAFSSTEVEEAVLSLGFVSRLQRIKSGFPNCSGVGLSWESVMGQALGQARYCGHWPWTIGTVFSLVGSTTTCLMLVRLPCR